MRQQIDQHQLVARDDAAFQGQVDRVDHQVRVFRFNDAAGDRVLFVDRDRDFPRRNVVPFRSERRGHFGDRIVEPDPFVDHLFRGGRFESFFDRQVIVPVGVFVARQGERHGIGVVALQFHLVYVPVGAQVAHVHHADVGAHPFDFLCVPQREGVVVSVVHDDRVGQGRFQVIHPEVAGYETPGAVVVVPVFSAQQGRYDCADQRCRYGRVDVISLEPAFERFVQGRYAESDPHAERVERSRENVVPFPRLGRRRIQVDGDRHARHDEEGHDDRKVSAVSVQLVDQPDDTEDER